MTVMTETNVRFGLRYRSARKRLNGAFTTRKSIFDQRPWRMNWPNEMTVPSGKINSGPSP
jgi:hypothetical protein